MKKSRYQRMLVLGFCSTILALTLTDKYYNAHIEPLTNDLPVANTKGAIMHWFLHFISVYVGKVGVQVFFGVVAVIAFYFAYMRYKKAKQEERDWEEYKRGRK